MSVDLRNHFEEAVSRHRAGDNAAAEAAYRQLIIKAPYIGRTFGNLVTLLRSQSRYEEAEATCREWIEAHPNSSHAKYRLALLLLRRGAYEEGWNLYEHRVAIPEHGIKRPRVAMPEWHGDQISSLLVWFEQGFGDCIQFGRYIPALRSSGVRVSMVVQPAIRRLFQPICDSIYTIEEASYIPQHDAWCLIGSLPHLTGWHPQSVYLRSSSAAKGVGVVCRGNEQPDPRRTLDDVSESRLLAIRESVNLLPEATLASDFEDTAQIISRISEVITIDTAVAHLALAMGKPTTVLLPIDACWRWGDQQDRCTLYPAARLFRQSSAGVWKDVIDAALEDFSARSQ